MDADEALAEVETFPQDSIPSAGQLETISSSATIGHDKTRLSSITSTLRSAEPGWVTMCVNLGESVALGLVVAVKQPTSFKLVGLVRLSEEQLGHVRIGKKLLVRYPAYPVKEYGSHSATIDAVFASQRDGPSNGCPRENRISDKAAFDVRLSLDEPPTSTTEPIVLREGMTFEAELPIEKVRLLRLVLEPLLQEK